MNSEDQVSNDWSQRSCPLCGSREFPNRPEVQATSAAELMPWEAVRDSFVGFRKDQVFFSYFRCSGCQLLYCPWYFSADQLTDLYSQMPDNLLGEDKSTASKTQSGYVHWFMKKVPRSKNYLELGPDIGLVTREIVRQFMPERLGLVEPNLGVHGELRINAGATSAIEIVQYLDEIKTNGFDLVIGIHVFDHLLDPLADLKSLASKCQTGADLGLVVRNEGSLLRKIIKKKWPPFCLQHPQIYNPSTLKTMLGLGGWVLAKTGKSTNYFHLKHIAEMGFGILGIPKGFSKLVPPTEMPISLGNMIAIAVKD
jgi:hypothetical protein